MFISPTLSTSLIALLTGGLNINLDFSLGIYMFTLKYFTRTCGPLSLCGPTTIGLIRNGDIVKKFSRNISSQKTHDFDMVNQQTNILNRPLIDISSFVPWKGAKSKGIGKG